MVDIDVIIQVLLSDKYNQLSCTLVCSKIKKLLASRFVGMCDLSHIHVARALHGIRQASMSAMISTNLPLNAGWCL